jgi:hypothetical protein
MIWGVFLVTGLVGVRAPGGGSQPPPVGHVGTPISLRVSVPFVVGDGGAPDLAEELRLKTSLTNFRIYIDPLQNCGISERRAC